MINLNKIKKYGKKCNNAGCIKHPVFNIPTEKYGKFCFEHKLENMIDVKNKRCNHDGCIKIPNFNIPTEKDGTLCEC